MGVCSGRESINRMPRKYSFTRTSDGVLMSLDEIDRLICVDLGVSESKDVFSQEFIMITLIGDRVLANGTWRESVFLGIKTMSDRLQAVARKYLNGEYKYDSWIEDSNPRR